MLVKDTFSPDRTRCSFEFFPPKDEAGQERLLETVAALTPLEPAHVSVTYGAGGTTQERSHTVVDRLNRETDLNVVAHLTCVGASGDDMRSIIQSFADSGVRNILALRGDAPKGHPDWKPTGDSFHHAADLVAYIRSEFPDMGIGVAGFPEGHPETPNRMQEIEYLKAKVDAGADYIVTQLFFDNRDYYDYCERCLTAGINIPVVAGIMPVISKEMLPRLSELAAGSRIPARMQQWIDRVGDNESVTKLGIHWAAEQVRDLIDHRAAGIHFYTLNQAGPTLGIFDALGLKDSSQV